MASCTGCILPTTLVESGTVCELPPLVVQPVDETLSDLIDRTLLSGSVYVTGRTNPGDGYEGTFTWKSGDQSANVTADTKKAIWVAPSSDTTGASGAWKREYTGLVYGEWFGVVGDNVADDTAAILATSNFGDFNLTGTHKISSNLTIASNLVLLPGASLVPDAAVTVTFQAGIDAIQEVVFDYASGGAFDFTESSYVYNISHFTGTSFNAKWDNLRASLTDGYHYTLIVPIPNKSEVGAVAQNGTDKWHWKVDGEIVLDTAENNGHWITLGQFWVTAAITNCFKIGHTTKTEDIDFAHPLWINVDTAGSGSCTNAVLLEGVSRLYIPGITVNNCSNAITIDPANVVSYIAVPNIQAGNDCRALNIDVTASSCTNVMIDVAQSEIFTSAGNNAVRLSGPMRNIRINRVMYNKSTGVTITDAVLVENNSFGRMNFSNFIDEVYCDATTAVRIQDSTAGVGSKTDGLRIGFIGNQAAQAAMNADFCENCYLEDWLPGQGVTIGSDSSRFKLDLHRSRGSDITDNGSLTIINNMGVQAIATGVEPTSANFKIGEQVYNSSFPGEVWIKIKDTGTDATDFVRIA